MAGVYFLVLAAGLLLEVNGLPIDENTGGLYITREAANGVLVRRRRFNSGLEEMLKDNLERECIEELCNMEEAREWFENDEQTLEFWAGYQDGDQCKPPPCLNGGSCQDGISSYVCWCKPDFSGKNCEIEVSRQCSVNNGGCSHFCVMKKDAVVCRCAAGYRLSADRKTCEPTEQFSCGRVYSASSSTARHRRSLPPPPDAEIDSDLGYDYSDLNTTEPLYEYEDSRPVNSTLNLRSARTRTAGDAEASDPQPTFFPLWDYFAALPNVTAKENLDQRIVGGQEASPGQLPWQVALMRRSANSQWAEPFCGGSLIRDTWVITAAHCVYSISIQDFFVRAGEHDVKAVDATERDHTVAEKHLHFLYDHQRSKYDHDIALLRLATPVELSAHRSPICLGPKNFIEDLMRTSSTSVVSGWGRLKFNGLEATRLQMLEVPYVERTICKGSSRDHVTTFMFCAGFQSELKDACQGDSGGPHATQYKGIWFLTGIVSWGEECAKDGKYGIYTRVSRYFPWISKTTGIRIN